MTDNNGDPIESIPTFSIVRTSEDDRRKTEVSKLPKAALEPFQQPLTETGSPPNPHGDRQQSSASAISMETSTEVDRTTESNGKELAVTREMSTFVTEVMKSMKSSHRSFLFNITKEATTPTASNQKAVFRSFEADIDSSSSSSYTITPSNRSSNNENYKKKHGMKSSHNSKSRKWKKRKTQKDDELYDYIFPAAKQRSTIPDGINDTETGDVKDENDDVVTETKSPSMQESLTGKESTNSPGKERKEGKEDDMASETTSIVDDSKEPDDQPRGQKKTKTENEDSSDVLKSLPTDLSSVKLTPSISPSETKRQDEVGKEPSTVRFSLRRTSPLSRFIGSTSDGEFGETGLTPTTAESQLRKSTEKTGEPSESEGNGFVSTWKSPPNTTATTKTGYSINSESEENTRSKRPLSINKTREWTTSTDVNTDLKPTSLRSGSGPSKLSEGESMETGKDTASIRNESPKKSLKLDTFHKIVSARGQNPQQKQLDAFHKGGQKPQQKGTKTVEKGKAAVPIQYPFIDIDAFRVIPAKFSSTPSDPRTQTNKDRRSKGDSNEDEEKRKKKYLPRPNRFIDVHGIIKNAILGVFGLVSYSGKRQLVKRKSEEDIGIERYIWYCMLVLLWTGLLILLVCLFLQFFTTAYYYGFYEKNEYNTPFPSLLICGAQMDSSSMPLEEEFIGKCLVDRGLCRNRGVITYKSDVLHKSKCAAITKIENVKKVVFAIVGRFTTKYANPFFVPREPQNVILANLFIDGDFSRKDSVVWLWGDIYTHPDNLTNMYEINIVDRSTDPRTTRYEVDRVNRHIQRNLNDPYRLSDFNDEVLDTIIHVTVKLDSTIKRQNFARYSGVIFFIELAGIIFLIAALGICKFLEMLVMLLAKKIYVHDIASS